MKIIMSYIGQSPFNMANHSILAPKIANNAQNKGTQMLYVTAFEEKKIFVFLR